MLSSEDHSREISGKLLEHIESEHALVSAYSSAPGAIAHLKRTFIIINEHLLFYALPFRVVLLLIRPFSALSTISLGYGFKTTGSSLRAPSRRRVHVF